MSGIIDFVVCFRLLQLLLTDWEKTEQYKKGIVDKNGKWLVSEKEMTLEQKKVYSPLVRFAFNLRKFINKVPGGKLGAAAVVLQSLRKPVYFKEEIENCPNVYNMIETSILILENTILEEEGSDGELQTDKADSTNSDNSFVTTKNIAMPEKPVYFKKGVFKRKNKLNQIKECLYDVEMDFRKL
nr:MAG TPA: Major capsid protein [Caudoviricetes sp.]